MSDTNFIKDNLYGSVPTQVANEVIKNIVEESIAFNICRHTSMESEKKVIPMLKDTGRAFWVDEAEDISTSVQNWQYPELVAKKLAVIVPVTREKVEDSVLNVMNEIKSGIKDAFVRAIDSAVFFGTDSPFDTSIFGTASNSIELQEGIGIDELISDAMGKIEENDFVPNGIIAPTKAKNTLRKLRDQDGNAIVLMGGISGSSIYNTPIYYPTSKTFDTKKAEYLVGDFNRAIIGTREGIDYEVLSQATVGGINLAEKDMIAIKCRMRFGFKIVDGRAFSKIILPKTELQEDDLHQYYNEEDYDNE